MKYIIKIDNIELIIDSNLKEFYEMCRIIWPTIFPSYSIIKDRLKKNESK